MSTIPADRLIELHEQLQGAANTLARVANEVSAYVPPKALPNEPLSDIVILVSDHDRTRFVSALSLCANVVDAARKAFDQHGGGRAA
jgi:hypothetical protein